MATFTRFEEIQAWQLGRELNRAIYRLTSASASARDFGLRDQIRRAAISVTSNIAEGHGRRSPRDFARFLDIAAGSVSEVQSQLYLALDLSYLDKDAFDSTMALTRRIAGALFSLRRYLRDAPADRDPDTPYASDGLDGEP